MFTGGEKTGLVDLLGGIPGTTFTLLLFATYSWVTFTDKKKEMNAMRVDADFKEAQIRAKEAAITDIMNGNRSLYFKGQL